MKEHILRPANGRNFTFRYTYCGQREGSVNSHLRAERRQGKINIYTCHDYKDIAITNNICKVCLNAIRA